MPERALPTAEEIVQLEAEAARKREEAEQLKIAQRARLAKQARGRSIDVGMYRDLKKVPLLADIVPQAPGVVQLSPRFAFEQLNNNSDNEGKNGTDATVRVPYREQGDLMLGKLRVW